jgi:hypothetical protein
MPSYASLNILVVERLMHPSNKNLGDLESTFFNLILLSYYEQKFCDGRVAFFIIIL